MSAFIKTVRKWENKFDRSAEYFAFHHPVAAFLLMFIGMPILILIAVSILTTMIALPLAWIFGWM